MAVFSDPWYSASHIHWPWSAACWFLRQCVPLFYNPLTHLFSISLATSSILHHWKQISICPVNKNSSSKNTLWVLIYIHHSCFSSHHWTDYVYFLIVLLFFYSLISLPFAYLVQPQLLSSPFCIPSPTSSPVTTNQFVIVIALEFTKAFDAVRHSTLLNIYSQMDILDHITGWSSTSMVTCTAPSTFSALTLLVGHQEEHSARKKLEWWGTGMVVCLECGANDLHLVQLMPLGPFISCSVKSRMVYLSGAGLPGLSFRKGHKTCVCVCVCV